MRTSSGSQKHPKNDLINFFCLEELLSGLYSKMKLQRKKTLTKISIGTFFLLGGIEYGMYGLEFDSSRN